MEAQFFSFIFGTNNPRPDWKQDDYLEWYNSYFGDNGKGLDAFIKKSEKYSIDGKYIRSETPFIKCHRGFSDKRDKFFLICDKNKPIRGIKISPQISGVLFVLLIHTNSNHAISKGMVEQKKMMREYEKRNEEMSDKFKLAYALEQDKKKLEQDKIQSSDEKK